MLRTALVVVLALGPAAGCVEQPHNPQEFRQAVRGGSFMTRLEEKTLKRDFPTTLADVTRRVEQCFNKTETHSTPGAGLESLNYHSTVNRRPDGVAEFAVQMSAANLIGDIPRGGVYILVVDIQGTEPSS